MPTSRLRFRSFLFLAFCILVLLAGCGSESQDLVTVSGTTRPQVDGPLAGVVFFRGEPVSGAPVQLRLNGGLLKSTTTGESGDFFLLTPRSLDSLPSVRTDATSLEITATVEGATLTASVPIGESYITVNELSTLVSDYLQVHPEATYAGASMTVAASLGIPTDEDLTRLSDSDIFDPATLVQIAEGQGGLNAFLDQVAPRCDTEDFDFSLADPFRVLEVAGQDPHGRVTRSPGSDTIPIIIPDSVFKDIGKDLAKKVLGKVGDKALGWFFGKIGVNTGPDLSDIAERLDNIEKALAALRSELAAAFTRASLQQAFNTLLSSTVQMDRFNSDQIIANSRRPEPFDDLPRPVPTEVTNYLNDTNFNAASAEIYAREYFAYLLSQQTQAGFSPINIVTEYNKLVSQTEFGNPAPTSTLAFYDLRFNEQTKQLQRNLNYGIAKVETASDMLANAAHSSYLRAPDLTAPYPANPLVSDIAGARLRLLAGVSQAVGSNRNDFAALRRRALQQVPPTLPRDDVIVLNGMPQIDGDTPVIAYRGAWRAITKDSARALSFPNEWTVFLRRIGAPWRDSENWRLPTRAEMAFLDARAVAAGGGDIRLGYVKLGFFASSSDVPPYFFTAETRFFFTGRPTRGIVEATRARPLGNSRQYTSLFYSERRPSANNTGALFIRGSLSGNTQAQANTILATGTAVKPTLTVSEPAPGKLKAMATYKFSNGRNFNVDVTDRVEWLSSNTAQVEVSNLDNESGELIRKAPGTVRITAAFMTDFAAPGSVDSYAIGVTDVVNTVSPVLKEIEVTPRNTVYLSQLNPAAYFYCTGYLGEDGDGDDTYIANDLTNSVTWSLLDSNGNPVNTGLATISNSTDPSSPGGILRLLSGALQDGIYTVRAEFRNSPGDPEPTFLDETKISIRL